MIGTDEAILIYGEYVTDEYGVQTREQKEYPVLVDIKSITRTEFYQSMQAGAKPSIVFEMRKEDYEETKIIVDGIPTYADQVKYEACIYQVLRTYSPERGKLEVICSL